MVTATYAQRAEAIMICAGAKNVIISTSINDSKIGPADNLQLEIGPSHRSGGG